MRRIATFADNNYCLLALMLYKVICQRNEFGYNFLVYVANLATKIFSLGESLVVDCGGGRV